MKPKIKICGITNIIDAKNALNLGADYIGFVSIDSSKRHLSLDEISQIVSQLTDEERQQTVLLTDLTTADGIISQSGRIFVRIVQAYGRLVIQDYGTLKSLGYKIFKPLSVNSVEDIEEIDEYRSFADLVILDYKDKDELGGTGRTFDWEIFNKAKELTVTNLSLAGGLSPENIEDAIKTTKPYMVDVSSGLESEPGIKSLDRMKDFFNKVNKACACSY